MFHRPPVLHRLFFAIRPPIVLARQIANASPWFDGARGLLPAERLHVTLVILDDCVEVPGEIIAVLRNIGRRIAAAPFRLTLDTVAGSDRSVALRPRLRNAALNALRRQIATEVARAGIAERADYCFSPHVTLGYRDGHPFTEPIAPVTWPVDTIELIHSHVGRTRHDILDRWMLDGTDEGQLPLF